MLKTSSNRDFLSEADFVDSEGIIIASSEDGYKGFDTHSNEQLTEFLRFFDGSSEVYSQDMKLKYTRRNVHGDGQG